jgi:hypothetical protein
MGARFQNLLLGHCWGWGSSGSAYSEESSIEILLKFCN